MSNEKLMKYIIIMMNSQRISIRFPFIKHYMMSYVGNGHVPTSMCYINMYLQSYLLRPGWYANDKEQRSRTPLTKGTSLFKHKYEITKLHKGSTSP